MLFAFGRVYFSVFYNNNIEIKYYALLLIVRRLVFKTHCGAENKIWIHFNDGILVFANIVLYKYNIISFFVCIYTATRILYHFRVKKK